MASFFNAHCASSALHCAPRAAQVAGCAQALAQ